MGKTSTLPTVLKYTQVILYLVFIALWFKLSYPLLKPLKISFLIPLVPLLILSVVRFFISLRKRKINIRLKWHKDFILLLLILLLATAVRVPYFIYSSAVMIGDDGMTTLMGKHLAEGEPASVFNYGVVHQGSFSQHIFALFFKVFGYSVLGIKIWTFLFFLGFLWLQFLFLRKIFSTGFAFAASLFHCLPIGNIVLISLDTINSFPILFFFCSLVFLFTYQIYYEDKDGRIPWLGFLCGILFWDHQQTIFFIMTSFIFFVLKYRLQIKKYVNLGYSFLLGSAPVVLFEIFNGFTMMKWIFAEEKIDVAAGQRVKNVISLMTNLISHETHFLNYVYLFFMLLGMAGIVYFSLRQRKLSSQTIYVVFFLVSMAIYFLSRFSAAEWIRYLYPFYFGLPVILLASFGLFHTKLKYVFMIIFILGMCVFSNLKGSYDNLKLVRQADLNLKNLVHLMEGTGNKYWFGEYWSAFLLTALSEEKLIGYPFDFPPYYPYWLAYFNEGHNNNFVFIYEIGSYALHYKEYLDGVRKWKQEDIDQANNLIRLVEELGVPAKVKRIGGSILVYEIEGDVFVSTTFAPVPEGIPRLKIHNIESSNGYLSVTLRKENTTKDGGFRLHMEIPGYSAYIRPFSPKKEEIKIRIPFPRKDAFKIKYYLDYKGLNIPSTMQEVLYSTQEKDREAKRNRIVYLSGVGPIVTFQDKKRRIYQKEVKIEINRTFRKKSKLRLYLYSPFRFSDPNWFGTYSQQVKVWINDRFLMEEILSEGENVLDLEIMRFPLSGKGDIITLKFKYHLPFGFGPLWKIAALLENIEIIE